MRSVEARVSRLERDRRIRFHAGCPECGGHGKPRWEILGGIRGAETQRFGGCPRCTSVSALRRIDLRLPHERAPQPGAAP